MRKEEKIIVRGIQNGDKAIFKRLYEQQYYRLFLYAKSYIQEEQIAEDIVQDIFFTLWKKRKDIVIKNSITSYLYRAIHNKCIQYLRHQKITKEYEKEHALKEKEANILYYYWNNSNNPSGDLDTIENVIQTTILSFPEKTKEIFNLSRESELPNKEISKKLNIDIKTVEYHISKALKSFRKALKEFL